MFYPEPYKNFTLIDYSEMFFKKSAAKRIPAKRSGKFVQLRNKNTEYLVLSPKELFGYHANIVERFFTEKGIRGTFNKKRDYYAVTDSGWDIVGGGAWTVDDKDKQFKLSGSSAAYGRYDRRGLRERILGVKKFLEYDVEIK